MKDIVPILDWSIWRPPTRGERLCIGVPFFGRFYDNEIKEKINGILQKRTADMLDSWNDYPVERKKLDDAFWVIKKYQGFCNSIFLPDDSFSILCNSCYYEERTPVIDIDILNEICRILNRGAFRQSDSFFIRSLVLSDDLPVIDIDKEMTLAEALRYISSFNPTDKN